MSQSGKNALMAAQLVQVGTSIAQAASAALDAGQPPTDFGKVVKAFFTGVLAANGGGTKIGQLLGALNDSTEGWTPSGPLGVLGDGLKNVLDAIQFYNDWKNSLGNCQKSSINFDEALAAYNAAWFDYTVALAKANLDCSSCPPPNPNPPKPPHPHPINPDPTPVPPKNSFDPNDKLTTGFGVPAFIRPGGPITYTILFENQASAGLPAQTIVITDTLSSNLDWSTLQLGSIGFNNVNLQVSPGLQAFTSLAQVSTDPNPVRVNASINPTNGAVSWLMQSLDPITGLLVTDPLAGFLPPDNAQQAGEGYVTYTIQAKPGLPTGLQILNRANIVFDVNAAIDTPLVTNTIDGTPPVSSMTPLPAISTQTNLLVSWSGTDIGSGIESYTIYESINGGPWSPWLQDTTNTAAIFPAAYGNSYAFYSVALDGVGNLEASPGIPGAETTVVSSGTPLLTSLSLTNGQLGFWVVASAGKSCVIQASTDLRNWTSIQTNVAPFLFTDSDNRARRFYRAMVGP